MARPLRRPPEPSRAYVDLARFLVGRHRRDLLLPLASAKAAYARAARLVDVARRHADAAAVRRLEIEAMKQRRAAERALFRIVEAIGEMDDSLVDDLGLMDGDGDGERLLADILLDE
jgi:hypothetical protein